ncbi:Fanconi anemia group D2 protein [Halyomorpha halys]|uniref:Fanconi anemia group D2 protein n=1 Tax=Halyomorpha halys TaxID=286706 RepID=UPI0006D506DD|nr:Fanconi anemia group D2 protein [Halyomorpha halys]
MYKRRKKLVSSTPQASSTMLDGKGLMTSFTSSQSSVISSIDARHVSDSPEDMFDMSPHKSNGNTLLLDITNTSVSSQPSCSKITEPKKTTNEVLEMLLSQEDEPLRKVPKINNKRTEERKLVLSQEISSIANKQLSSILSKAGMVLGDDISPNLLTKPQSVFVRNMSKLLDKSNKEDVKKFIENLEEFLSDTDCLKTALSPTKADPDSNILADSQDSLIRLLLSVECLQSQIISFLLDKICEFTADEDGNTAEEMMALVRMILQSLRYMNNVLEPEKLTRKMFDIIHAVSSSMLKHEITNCLPDIISDAQREETANEFIELMKSEPSLTPSILYTLSNLWLDGDSLYQLQMSLIRQLRNSPLDQLPAYVRFLVMGDIISHADEIINGLRSELVICHADGSSCTQVQNGKSSDVQSTLLLVFEKLRDAVLKSKKLADIWVKNIGKVKKSIHHKPIDLLMLLIIHSTSKSDVMRKRTVETMFRAKIRSGHFRDSLIQDTLSATSVVIREHYDDLLKLLSTLLLSPDLTVSSFSAYFFSQCFEKLDSLQWRKRIILELISNITVAKGNAKPALNLLHSLTSKYTSKIAPFITLLMLLLDVVMELKVVEIRQLMDMLCMIAFGDASDNSIDNIGVQDEICMIVQKQLSCPEPAIFRSGIIAAIVTIRHMVKKGENDTNETPSSEEEIQLDGNGKKAMNLLDLVLTGTRANAEVQVLAFDQLAYMVLNADNLDKIFMKKVSIMMQGYLQNHYIIASSDYLSKDNGLDSSLQFCIDTDLEDPIVFNLVDAVVLETNSSKPIIPIVALPGLVRLIRALELADLTEIDALLGCAISLPSPAIYTKFGNVEVQIQNLALDCLFHVCNFLREMLNSFVYFVKDGKPDKILKRLRAVVYFQNLISVCLPQAYDYSPPVYYLDEIGKKPAAQSEKSKKVAVPKRKKTAGRKKAKDKSNEKDKEKDDNETIDETAVSVESEDEEDVELISLEFSKFKCHLRELEFDVCIVLTQPLVTMPKPIQDGFCSAELGPNELMLILDDLNSKLRYCMSTSKGVRPRKEPVGFDVFSTVPLDLVVTNVSKLAHHLCNHLHKIVEYLHNLLIINDGILDATGMFCTGSNEIKQCLTLILSVFNVYLSWPDLTSEVYSQRLMKTLIKLGGPNINKKDVTCRNEALTGALSYLRDITKCVLDLTSAVGLVTLMSTLVSLQEPEGDKFDPELGDLCEDFLRRKWYDSKGAEAKGTSVNQQLCVLLDIFLNDGDNCLKNVSKTLNWLSLECETLGNDNSLTTFPHFNKNNLNVIIRSICKGLLGGTKKVLEGKDYKEQLEVWESVTNCLQELIAIIKIHDSRINLRQFLKGSLPILRYFLSHGMNICSSMFMIESTLVSQTIKKLQVVTRYIQSICNYSKLNKDSSLIQQLPGIRGTLENILLSVKNMVLQNKCAGAFFMGSMRNKDIHGEIISADDTTELGDSEEITPTVAAENTGAETSGNESDHSNASHTGSISDVY